MAPDHFDKNALELDGPHRLIGLDKKADRPKPERRKTCLGPVYNEAAAHRMTHALEAAHAQGAIVFGGRRANIPADLRAGQYFEPTLMQVDMGHVLTRETVPAASGPVRLYGSGRRDCRRE